MQYFERFADELRERRISMKYIIVLADGMADEKQEALQGKTPMMAARTPNMDRMAASSEILELFTIPEGLPAGSDVGNLSIMGYDPRKYYAGRSPLEALSIGVPMVKGDVTYRINLVTLSGEAEYEEKRMLDYSAGEISTEESRELIAALQESLSSSHFHFYAGVSYRHILLQKGGQCRHDFTPPHDISDRLIREHLPKDPAILDLMKRSYSILHEHPINRRRIAAGKRPANSIWAWGEGSPIPYPSFQEQYGLHGAVITAVDLLRGIAIGTGMDVISVKGATGNKNTNFAGKGEAAIQALRQDADFVYIHVEAPDECGHGGDLEGKIYSIEQIDEKIVGPILAAMESSNEPFVMVVTPDHPTPVRVKTHTRGGVPCLIYRSDKPAFHEEAPTFSEEYADTRCAHMEGCKLMEYIVKQIN